MFNSSTARLLALMFLVLVESSCIAVGYTSRGGWSVLPGGFGLLLMLGVVALIFFASVFRR